MLKFFEKFISPRKKPLTLRQLTGLWGERKAESYLAAKGYKIIDRRVRVGLRDEIDLIARLENILVFVEVKTRAGEDFGRPFSAVNRSKRYHAARAAVRYLKRLKSLPASFRFDVVEIVGRINSPAPVIRHIENAFPLPGYFRVP
jgi:putative endonuclease